MRTVACLFAIALFAASFALSLQEAREAYFGANGTVVFRTLRAQGAYSLVVVNGNESAVFDSAAGALVKDRQMLIGILREDEYARAGFLETKLNASRFWSLYMLQKEKVEKTCEQYTGIGSVGCVGTESCLKACIRVPLCAPLSQAAGFLEGVQRWAGERGGVDALVDEFNAGIAEAFESAGALQGKIVLLQKIREQAAKVENNPIFLNYMDEQCKTQKCFAFCPKPNYSQKEALALEEGIELAKDALYGEAERVQRANSLFLNAFEIEKGAKASGGPMQEGVGACMPFLALVAVLGLALAKK